MEILDKFTEIITSKDTGKIVSTRFNESYFIKNDFKSIWDDFNSLTENLKEVYPLTLDRLIAARESLNVQLCNTCKTNPRMITRDDKTTKKILSKYCCVKCSSSSKDKVEKFKETLSKNPNIKEQAKQKRSLTMLGKYGYEYNSQRPEIKPRLVYDKIPKNVKEKLLDKNWVQENYINQKKSLSQIGQELSIYYGTVREYVIKHGFEIHHEYSDSVEQNTIENFLISLGVDYQKNCNSLIKPYEVDFYLPEHDVAIEINGVHWHGEYHKDSKYQENKCNLAQQSGNKLLNFYCRDIWEKFDIVQSIIKNSIGLTVVKYHARKCQIKTPTKIEEIKFLKDNHIQGHINSCLSIGLYFEDELVSIMTFTKKDRFNHGYEWELLRQANKVNCVVVGGFSKLLNYFEKTYKPKSLISYCNKSISNGNVYDVNGFAYSHDSSPGYYWYKGNKLYSRHRTRKSNLHNILENFDKNLSEAENMTNNGYKRVWDCLL